jgi:hypothetical protein
LRNERLFKDFLSGRTRAAKDWKASYMNNPVLNRVAQLLVWVQGKNTFTLTDKFAINCDGQAYSFTDEPISIAHPMEMTPQECTFWQNYFLSNGLKQPFIQIWEPVIDGKTVKSDRYTGYKIPIYRFMNQKKHGIFFYDHDFHNDIGFYMDACNLKFEPETLHRHKLVRQDNFILGEFTFSHYNRKVNHIVSLLDKWIISERILKDDTSIEPLLSSFTAAQIVELIKLSTDNNCTQVTALLLNYQHSHFPAIFPTSEFTLD